MPDRLQLDASGIADWYYKRTPWQTLNRSWETCHLVDLDPLDWVTCQTRPGTPGLGDPWIVIGPPQEGFRMTCRLPDLGPWFGWPPWRVVGPPQKGVPRSGVGQSTGGGLHPRWGPNPLDFDFLGPFKKKCTCLTDQFLGSPTIPATTRLCWRGGSPFLGGF